MVTKDEVVTVLKDCYDPEIPINIWDLGLVYDINIQEDGNVGIKMTLTAPGCMMGGMIADEVKAKLKRSTESKMPRSTSFLIHLGLLIK